MIESKANFIAALHADLQNSINQHIENGGYFGNIGNFDCGNTALKRKIIYLRRELLNLAKIIDEERPWNE